MSIRKSGSAGGGGFYMAGGGGGCYEHFREKYGKEFNLRVNSSNLSVQLLNDLNRAEYIYEYKIEVIGDENEKDWFFEIPFPEEKVVNIWAKDKDGGLQFLKNTEERSKTKITFNFRKKLKKDDTLIFSFGYETDILALVTEGVFKSTVTYSDWASHNVECKSLKIEVNLPENSKPLNTVPPANLSHNPVIYDVENLRPLEYYSFLLHYKKRKLGKPFWIWVSTTILSAAIGSGFNLFYLK